LIQETQDRVAQGKPRPTLIMESGRSIIDDAEVLIFGNPKGGTMIMKLDPAAGLDLPLRVLVYTDNEGKTWLSYHNPQTLKNSYDVEKSPVIDKVEGGLAKLTAKAAE